MPWEPTSTVVEDWGRIQVIIGGEDVTFFRDVPTRVESWGEGEPFGDTTATIVMPQVSPFEQLGVGALSWLTDWADVEVYHIEPDGSIDEDPLFEGMVASFNSREAELRLECIGALYQVDLYVRAPGFIIEPVRNEALIRLQFKQQSRPNLRTQEMVEPEWPDWWGIDVQDPSAETHRDAEGNLITGFDTQFTGDWGPALGYVQELISYMQEPDDGLHGRIIWTVHKDPGRKPVMRLKDITTVHWTMTLGTPGLSHDLNRDLAQAPNTYYGEGTDQAGMKWRNAFIGINGVTFYRPLAVWDEVSPVEPETLHEDNTPNPDFDPTEVRFEVHQTYGVGVSLQQAIDSATEQLERERDPGWFGTLTLKVDPEEGSRFDIKSGQNILLKHHRGENILLHIALVEVDLPSLRVTLTVDSRARDLLALAEVLERRSRYNKSPARMLRVGRESGQITDERSPWDENAGAGLIPRASKEMQLASIDPDTAGFRPVDNASLYVTVNSDAPDSRSRWTIVEVVTQQYGTIALTEFTAYDELGNIKAVPFHVGVYSQQVWPEDMPLDPNGEFNPFTIDTFDPVANPDAVHPASVILWGQEGQRAGYHPGLESEGNPVTGVFRDEGSWDYRTTDEATTSLWVAIYCEDSDVTYFQGRFFRGGDG